MDRYEYKTKVDEIKELMRQGKQQEAVDIVDSMNWNRIHNVNALLSASSIYQEVGRMEDSKELLLLAHDRSPIGRMIIYHLALVSIQLNELGEAEEYYNEFVEIAPHDSLKYIIKYRLNKAKGADNSTLIGILEELKDREFLEEWSYELAYLYHKTAQVDKCIDLCDEIILWFGDGPFVERALELKMLYQPLDKMQEDKYRQFQQRKDGITEIRANEYVGSGEIIPRTITIPEIELPAERFNTVNLQAEIKKNIEEIMKATEAGEVSENMENIKMLVEEIPYLQVSEDEPFEAVKPAKQDGSLLNTFQEYLAEEYDGQMSLFVPEKAAAEVQVRGQMTIEDIMAEWEKTRRAAEAALEDAKQQEFENTKAQALKEATQIMDRLEDAIPRLDAGATPTDLLKQEYLAQEPQESQERCAGQPEDKTEQEESAKEEVSTKEETSAPQTADSRREQGFCIPKIAPEGKLEGVGLEIPIIPPEEIQALMGEKNVEVPAVTKPDAPKDTKDWRPPMFKDKPPASESSQEADGMVNEEAKRIADGLDHMVQKEIDKLYQGLEEEKLPEIQNVVLEPEEVASLVDEKVLEKAIENEMPPITLNREEKEIFSYFMPMKGMENSICQALTGARARLMNAQNSSAGNIIIQGGRGSGKSMLAKGLIKVLQKEIGRPNDNIGKIDGDKLNEKDLPMLFQKIAGGCLIVEKAGKISRETAVSLSLLMENDTTGILMILEDSRLDIERLMARNLEFAKKFTEKITVPVFTIDELVAFGKTYALEEGYVVDEMGVLAMYNRINLIQRLDHPTSLVEVKEIMDQAIDRAERPGIKGVFGRIGAKRYNEDGNLILREKDFEI